MAAEFGNDDGSCSCSCFQLNFTSAQHPAPFHLALSPTPLLIPHSNFSPPTACALTLAVVVFLRQRQATHTRTHTDKHTHTLTAHAHYRIELIHKNIVYIFIRLAKAINNKREKDINRNNKKHFWAKHRPQKKDSGRQQQQETNRASRKQQATK